MNQLAIGGIRVGGTQAVIREFSKEATFVANSNNIVPTQKAINILLQECQAVLVMLMQQNLVAGVIAIDTNTITTTSGGPITFTARQHFHKPVRGDMAAMQMFAAGGDSGNARTN